MMGHRFHVARLSVAAVALMLPGNAPTVRVGVSPVAPRSSSLAQRALMPWPASITLGEGSLRIDSTTAVGMVRFSNPRLERAAQRLRERLARLSRNDAGQGAAAPRATRISIAVAGAGQPVQGLDEDESYELIVDTAGAVLRAPTVVGALRGIETLLQLTERGDGGGARIPAVHIADAPRFRWRGLLVDVARHFVPVEGMKRTLDGMAAVKLNVLHWHLSDDQAFRVESRRLSRLHTVASGGQYYTQAQVRELVAYAADRGIRVVPEFDMPGHTTAILAAYPQYASIPGKYAITTRFGWGDASMDPAKEATFVFLGKLVAEMVTLFPDAYWHVGGDEVNARHWSRSASVRAFRRRTGLRTNDAVHAYFNRRVAAILTRHHRTMVGWDEVLNPRLPRGTVVQSWRGEKYVGLATAAGHPALLSAPWYLDHIQSAEEHYAADPIPPWTELTAEQQQLVLGGEACMWTEHVDAATIDSRIWPRLAAIAERLWSPREVNNIADMYQRLREVEERLDEFGLGHVSHTDRFLQQTVSSADTRRAIALMLEAVGPPTFGQRVRGMVSGTETPLTGMIDAAVPDPWGRFEISRLVGELLAESVFGPALGDGPMTPAEARGELRGHLTRWHEAALVVRADSASGAFVASGAAAAMALERATFIGLEALEYVGGATRAPQGWGDLQLAELAQLEQPQNLLRVMIIPAVRRLVNAAAVNAHE